MCYQHLTLWVPFNGAPDSPLVSPQPVLAHWGPPPQDFSSEGPRLCCFAPCLALVVALAITKAYRMPGECL